MMRDGKPGRQFPALFTSPNLVFSTWRFPWEPPLLDCVLRATSIPTLPRNLRTCLMDSSVTFSPEIVWGTESLAERFTGPARCAVTEENPEARDGAATCSEAFACIP